MSVVKPLEWTEWPKGVEWRANSPIGTYTLSHDENAAGVFWLEGRIIRKRFNSLDEAKAAAQADYERRLLSALDLSAVRAEARQEALGDAVETSNAFLSGEDEWNDPQFGDGYTKGVTDVLASLRALMSSPPMIVQRSPLDVDAIEQAISDVLSEGGSYRDAAEYVLKCWREEALQFLSDEGQRCDGEDG